ncbi:MAG: sigma-70 family RNA polymerase sigma factor [Propionibacteriales bacterium]|nr:sigma-70 family RNA polymerase sigma factor [Propionibacteriales bacterium]
MMREQGSVTPQDEGHFFAAMLAAAQTSSGWAFEQVFRTYAPRVRGYVRAHGAVEPDELTNDVFVAVFRSLPKFHGDEAAFRSWLFTIARNRLVDERRRRARRVETVPEDITDSIEMSGGDVETEALANLGGEWVTGLLGQLTPDQRDVLLLRIVADLTIDQIAELLAKSPGAVKALQRRGLVAVKRVLDQGVPLERPVDV